MWYMQDGKSSQVLVRGPRLTLDQRMMKDGLGAQSTPPLPARDCIMYASLPVAVSHCLIIFQVEDDATGEVYAISVEYICLRASWD